MQEDSEWANLAPEILHRIVAYLPEPISSSIATVRLVCKAWREQCPPGLLAPATIWDCSDSNTEAALRHARHLEISAPHMLPAAPTLHRISTAVPHLRSLHMHQVSFVCLDATVGRMTQLRDLRLTVAFPSTRNAINGVILDVEAAEDKRWLQWASKLTNLTRLEVMGKPSALRHQAAVTALLPLHHNLNHLKLQDCTMATDASLQALHTFVHLTELSMKPSRFSPAGIRGVRGVFPDLVVFGSTHTDAASAATTLAMPGMRSIDLELRMSEAEYASFWNETKFAMPTTLESLAIHHSGRARKPLPRSFLASMVLLPRLKSLSIPKGPELLDCGVEMASELTMLHVRLHHLARDRELDAWPALTRLQDLHLHGNWFISDHKISALLEASMASLRSLELVQLQGDVECMLRPLEKAPSLQHLKLSLSRLSNVRYLQHFLPCLGHSLRSLSVRWSAKASDVAEAMATALPSLQRLKHLQLTFQSSVDAEALEKLASALGSCHLGENLLSLDVDLTSDYFAVGRPGIPDEVPAWRHVAALTRLRSLTVCIPLGWSKQAFEAVCGNATNLQRLNIFDGRRRVTSDWLTSVGENLPRLSHLNLEWCSELNGEAAIDGLGAGQLTAFTELRALKCPRLDNAEFVASLKAKLPSLVNCNVYG